MSSLPAMLPQVKAAWIRNVVLRVERHSPLAGQPMVQAGLPVQPETPVLTAPASVAQPLTLAVARELGIAPNEVGRHLVRPLGAVVKHGEPVAVARRGLRSVQVTAPTAGKLEAIDEEAGTLTLLPAVDQVQYTALIAGTVLSAEPRRVVLRTSGDVLSGCVLLGAETSGRLLVLVDRPDRELPPELVTSDVQGAIVVAGMTIGPATVQRLREAGARGVIVGSLPAETLRGALAVSLSGQSVGWGGRSQQRLRHAFRQAPLSILVTEGFGRLALAAPLFQRLQEANTELVALLDAESVPDIGRPSCIIVREGLGASTEIPHYAFASGLIVRRTDPRGLGAVGVCAGEPTRQVSQGSGAVGWSVPVAFAPGDTDMLPIENLEIVTAEDKAAR